MNWWGRLKIRMLAPSTDSSREGVAMRFEGSGMSGRYLKFSCLGTSAPE